MIRYFLPVSYTHLDVYKRQHIARITAMKNNMYIYGKTLLYAMLCVQMCAKATGLII